MSISVSASLPVLLLCGMLLAAAGPAGQAAGQPAGQPAGGQSSGTLQPPSKQKPATPPAPQPPSGAPRQKVHPAAAKPPPVVRPQGAVHAQKPTRPPAATQVAPAPPPAATPAEPPKPAADNKGSATSLPLPRFAALRSDEVNLRAGPGTRYPIEWVYKRRELPVEIQREFEVWRLVQDPDGIKGWVHSATLTGRRSFIVTAADATLRRDAQDTAAPVAVLKPGVVGHIRACPANTDWCQVQIGDYRGYLRRSQFWGTLPGETFTN